MLPKLRIAHALSPAGARGGPSARVRRVDLSRALAEALRALRRDAGLSQSEMAKALGVSRPTVTRLENADQNTTLRRWSNFLESCVAIRESSSSRAGWGSGIGQGPSQNPRRRRLATDGNSYPTTPSLGMPQKTWFATPLPLRPPVYQTRSSAERSVVHPDVPIGAVEQLLILVELVLEECFAKRHFDLALASVGVLPGNSATRARPRPCVITRSG